MQAEALMGNSRLAWTRDVPATPQKPRAGKGQAGVVWLLLPALPTGALHPAWFSGTRPQLEEALMGAFILTRLQLRSLSWEDIAG